MDYFAIRRLDKQWIVRRLGSSRALVVCASRREAWREARRRARGCGGCAHLIDWRTDRVVATQSYRKPPQ